MPISAPIDIRSVENLLSLIPGQARTSFGYPNLILTGSNAYGIVTLRENANDKPLKTVGTIEQIGRLGNLIVKLDFIVCESLAASFTFGADLRSVY